MAHDTQHNNEGPDEYQTLEVTAKVTVPANEDDSKQDRFEATRTALQQGMADVDGADLHYVSPGRLVEVETPEEYAKRKMAMAEAAAEREAERRAARHREHRVSRRPRC